MKSIRFILAAACAFALTACAGPAGTAPTVTPAQLAAAQAIVAIVCNSEQTFEDDKAKAEAAKRCAAEQSALAALQAVAGAASAPH